TTRRVSASRIDAPETVRGRRRRGRGGQALDALPHRRQHALALELAERDQAQAGADQKLGRGIKIGRGGGPWGAAAGETGEKRIVAEARGDPERLTPHLTARRPELGNALHRVEPLIEGDPVVRGGAGGQAHRDRARGGA